MKLKRLFGLLLCVAVVVLGVLAGLRFHNRTCNEVEIIISDKGSNSMMTMQSVEKMLKAADVYPLGKMVKDIRRDDIEKALQKDIWFHKLNNLSSKGSKVILNVAVKVPLVQVFPESGTPYIITADGNMLPLSPDIHDKLIVANGHILTQYAPKLKVSTVKDNTLKRIYNVANAIHNNEIYFSQYSQIFVAPDNQLQLYNNIFQHTALIGYGEDIDTKLANLQTVYSKGIVYMDHAYSQVDARFAKRIYATRKQ